MKYHVVSLDRWRGGAVERRLRCDAWSSNLGVSKQRDEAISIDVNDLLEESLDD